MNQDNPQAISDQLVSTFDLSSIVMKLTEKSPCTGWASDRVSSAIKWYRRFLRLCQLYPSESLVPPPDADEVWHTHILFTHKYMSDCEQIFGHYLHHCPSTLEEVVDMKGLQRTHSLFVAHFSESPFLCYGGISNADDPALLPCGNCRDCSRDPFNIEYNSM